MGGVVSIDHQDLAAYQFNIGIKFSAWEVKTIRALSRAYCNEFSLSSGKKTPAPYTSGVVMNDEARKQVSNAFKALAAQRKRK